MSREILLSQGKVALVDDEDYALVELYQWHYHPSGGNEYARSLRYGTGQGPVYMHRLILQAQLGQRTDHINGNGLDNRRCNLRIVTASENSYNSRGKRQRTSRWKGVSWHKAARKWAARIQVRGRYFHLGLFLSEDAAALAYNDAAREYHGVFARLNEV